MQKKNWFHQVGCAVFAAALLFAVSGCSNDPDEGGNTDPFETRPDLPSKIISGTNNAVKTLVYIEVNDENPLNAGSYMLGEGDNAIQYFDYVVLFAANIRSRNCAEDPDRGKTHFCTKNGPHVHLNGNVQHILDNRDKYIRPLREKGIQVLLGLLGDHDGIGFSSITDAEIATFAADVKKVVADYGLDGVDLDDEWASKEAWDIKYVGGGTSGDIDGPATVAANPSAQSIWSYPRASFWWPMQASTVFYRDPAKGFVPGNGTKTDPGNDAITRMWTAQGVSHYKTLKAIREALPGKIVSLYEINGGDYMSPNGVANSLDSSVTIEAVKSVIDFALNPYYNQFREASSNGLPRNIYGPLAMDVGGEGYGQGGTPNPPIVINGSEDATDAIKTYAARFKQAADKGNPYGYMLYYRLKPSSFKLKHDSSEADGNGSVTTQAYMSIVTNVVFGKPVTLSDDADYKQDWTKY